MAFHPRPHIASNLGCNITRITNRTESASNSQRELKFTCGRRFNSQRASTRCDLRIASPTRRCTCGGLNSSNRKPAGCIRRIRTAKWPQIVESPAIRPRNSDGFEIQQREAPVSKAIRKTWPKKTIPSRLIPPTTEPPPLTGCRFRVFFRSFSGRLRNLQRHFQSNLIDFPPSFEEFSPILISLGQNLVSYDQDIQDKNDLIYRQR